MTTGARHFIAAGCPVCGDTRAREIYRYRSAPFAAAQRAVRAGGGEPFDLPDNATFRVLRCMTCDIGYTSPRLTDAGAAKFYGEYYVGAYAEASDASVRFAESVYDQGSLPRDRRRAHALRRHLLAGRTLLDVGCSTGGFLLAAQRDGWEVCGVEVAPDAAARARAATGAPIHCGTLLDAPFPAGTYDAITMFALLEHLPDPLATLRHAATLLRPGGMLLFQVPSLLGIETRAHLLLREPARHGYIFEHLTYWTPCAIRAACRRANLVPQAITSRHWDETRPRPIRSLLGGLLTRGRPAANAGTVQESAAHSAEAGLSPSTAELVVEVIAERIKPLLESTDVGGRLCWGNVLVCWARLL